MINTVSDVQSRLARYGRGNHVDETVLAPLLRTLSNLPSEPNRDSLSHGRFTPRTLALSRRNKLSA